MHTRKRIGALIIIDKKLLLVSGHKSDIYWTPGGKIEENENDEECLRRELLEEVGMRLVSCKFFKEYNYMSLLLPDTYTISRIYLAEAAGDPVISNEIDSFIWLSREDYLAGKHNLMYVVKDQVIPELIEKGLF